MRDNKNYQNICPCQWECSREYRILVALSKGNKKGLSKGELEELTELSFCKIESELKELVSLNQVRIENQRYVLDKGMKKYLNEINSFNKE